MRTRLPLVAACMILAGCGASGGRVDRAGIRAALMHSPLSYLHYRSAAWTGSPPHPTLGLVRTEGRFAVARVSIPAGPKIFRVQWALLAHRSTWRVLDTVTGSPKYLPCTATRAVMKRLSGGCAGPVGVNEGGEIFGPYAKRAPTPAERQGAIAAAKRALGLNGHDACITYSVAISTVDPRFASTAFAFHKPYGTCHLFNGVDMFERTAGGWTYIGGFSGMPLACETAPPGVVRSLFGGCGTVTR